MLHTIDKQDLAPLVSVLMLIQEETEALMGRLETLLMLHIREQRGLVRSLPADKQRVLWSRFVDQISSRHFRRMFRMELAVFMKLCERVCQRIGKKSFKPEAYVLEHPRSSNLLSGEVKMAVCMHMLAGASHLDLVPSFSIGTSCSACALPLADSLTGSWQPLNSHWFHGFTKRTGPL